ncbi:unnamed protein product, partial [Echinostoma caproni]|uniref:Dolichyl-phosphate-mannose--protein mannosyltransferase n=1 Tax=Echinostoma caproni TaxID=27848 RepID=A0A183AMQ8_9TREM
MADSKVKNDRKSAKGRVKTNENSSQGNMIHGIGIRLLVFGIAISCGFLHWMHVAYLHENDLMFSHLSSTERELTFRTEMGFYYSYFKQLPLCMNTTHSGTVGLIEQQQQQPRCRPLNAMQRFNLYPELVLATIYRILRSYELLKTECYQVSRYLTRDPVAIVVNPTLFAQAIQDPRYLPTSNISRKCIFSKSINLHREKRWTLIFLSPLFTPICSHAQCYSTKKSSPSVFQSVIYCLLLLGFQLPWQFSQFALSTQVASLSKTSYLLQFGNALLLTSTYFPGLIGAWLGLTMLLRLMTPPSSGAVSPAPNATTVVLLVLINTFFGQAEHDGGHIVDILREKLQPGGKFHTFHTRLYTCSPEFDFIGVSAPGSFCLTQTEIFTYNRSTFQLLFFTLMAVLIMRLKLFWTPQLCLTLALLPHFQMFAPHPPHSQLLILSGSHWVDFGCCTFIYRTNLLLPQAEWNVRGQFSSINDEVMLDWFHSPSTPWVIAGTISTQGSLRLIYPSPQPLEPAGFALTNHPHYENAELRQRTVLAYAIYSRKPVDQYHMFFLNINSAHFDGTYLQKNCVLSKY